MHKCTRLAIHVCLWEARAGAVRLAHTDCLGEKRDEEKTTHALLSSLSMHAAQISSCFRFGLLITRSMGCAASRAPGGETRTRRYPPSMKPRGLLCEPRVRPQPTHTSEGDVHTLQAFSRCRVHALVQRSGQICTLQRLCSACICINPASALVHHMLHPRLGLRLYVLEAMQSCCVYREQ